MNINELKEKFIGIYGGTEEDLRIFSAPGRVNLIGEHTDYNGGYVFPAALTMKTTIIARLREDRFINLAATDLDFRIKASLDKLDEYKKLEWGNYQLGVADELQKAGYELRGCDLLYDDTIPHGAGLSSSAAIEVATAYSLIMLSKNSTDNEKNINLIEIAKISQKAENNYVGVNCGIMDQFASAMGKVNHAIFLDTKDLSYRLVPLNIDGYKIVISNTNKKRSLANSKYNERRSECEKGLIALKEVLPHVNYLGEIPYEEYVKHKSLIKNDIIRKRVEHVMSENNRDLESVKALESNNINLFGKLMIESHDSLRNDYEVTGVELDTLVEEALKINGTIGSWMTGAGYGCCTVSIVEEDVIDLFIEEVGRNYYERVGLKASFYVSEIGNGVKEIKQLSD